MRFRVIFDSDRGKGENVSLTITKDYRRKFISFLKKTFEVADGEFWRKLYSFREEAGTGRKIRLRKPFTFSVYLGKSFRIEKSFIEASLPFEFLFSTGDPLVASYFYNGVKKLMYEGYTLPNLFIEMPSRESSSSQGSTDDASFGGCVEPSEGSDNFPKLGIVDLSLAREDVIFENTVVFKTKQPILLTDPSRSRKDRDFYLVPEPHNFGSEKTKRWKEVLCQRVFESYEWITGKKLPDNLKKFDVEFFSPGSLRTTRVCHYGVYIPAFKGIFKASGSVELLNFVYQYGIGVKTGEGFGMLDVIAQGEVNNSGR